MHVQCHELENNRFNCIPEMQGVCCTACLCFAFFLGLCFWVEGTGCFQGELVDWENMNKN